MNNTESILSVSSQSDMNVIEIEGQGLATITEEESNEKRKNTSLSVMQEKSEKISDDSNKDSIPRAKLRGRFGLKRASSQNVKYEPMVCEY